MKAILLHTAFADNGGTRRDAGETVTVGEAEGDIVIEFAQALVDAGSAIEAAPAKSRGRTQPDAAPDEAE